MEARASLYAQRSSSPEASVAYIFPPSEARIEAPIMSAAPPHAMTPMASSVMSRVSMAKKVAKIGVVA